MLVPSAGGTPFTYGGIRASMVAPLPKITVEGTNFIRKGQPYKFWGFHTSVVGSGGILDMQDSTLRVPVQEEMIRTQRLKTNIMRVFLQMFDFVSGPDVPNLVFNQTALDNLIFWLDTARENGVYIKLCGGNVWIPAVAPAWYDALVNYEDRWDVQEFFYTKLVEGIVAAGHDSTIMGYDLTGEPVIKTDPDYPWYGYESYPGNLSVGGQYYNPCIARGPSVTDQTARDWIIQLTRAIKRADPQALCTVGTLPFIGGAFGRDNTQDLLDFVSPHIYPSSDEDIAGDTPVEQAQGWMTSTKPVVCGEYYSWSTVENNEALINELAENFEGLVSWGDGRLPEEITVPSEANIYEQILIAFNRYNTELCLSVREAFIGNNF
jgi:hypothetical protein